MGQAHPEPGRAAAPARRRGRAPPARAPHPAVRRGLALRTSRTSSTSPAASPTPHRCTSAGRARPTPTVAPPGHENLFVLVPIPADPAHRPRRRRRRRRRRGRDRRRPRDPADRDVVRHPRSRRPHRRAAHDRARRLRRRPALLARQRARPRAHARAERRVPAAQRVAQGARALRTREDPRCPGSGCRCASSPPSSCSSACAATAPRAPARAGQGVTCRDSTCWRSSCRAGGIAALDARWRLAAWSAPRRTAAAVAIGTAFFLLWDAVGIATGVFVKGDSPLLARHRPRPAAAARGAVLPRVPLLPRARRRGRRLCASSTPRAPSDAGARPSTREERARDLRAHRAAVRRRHGRS